MYLSPLIPSQLIYAQIYNNIAIEITKFAQKIREEYECNNIGDRIIL